MLEKIADYLANFCKMKSGDYPSAIQFFEDLILNPPSLPDSLFAVIDAGYAYLLLAQNSEKSPFVGELEWLKPKSVKAYLDTRNALINNKLTATSKDNEAIPDLPDAIRISNYPNPFNPSTTIAYSIPQDGKVRISIYLVKGQIVKEL